MGKDLVGVMVWVWLPSMMSVGYLIKGNEDLGVMVVANFIISSLFLTLAVYNMIKE